MHQTRRYGLSALIIITALNSACEGERLDQRTSADGLNAADDGPLVTPLGSSDGSAQLKKQTKQAWDKLMKELDETLSSCSQFILDYDIELVLSSNREQARFLIEGLNSLISATNLTLEEEKEANPTTRRLARLEETASNLSLVFAEDQRRLLALQQLKSPLLQTITLDGDVRPHFDCGEGADSCNPNQDWHDPSDPLAGIPQPPILVLDGLNSSMTIRVRRLEGTIISANSPAQAIACATGFQEATNDVPTLIPILQLTNDEQVVRDPGTPTPSDRFALPLNAKILREGGLPIKSGISQGYLSFPDRTYDDNSGSCTVAIEVLL